MGRRALEGGLDSNVGEGVLGVMFNDWRRKPRCFERFDVWAGWGQKGMGMPQGAREAYRNFRVRENFP